MGIVEEIVANKEEFISKIIGMLEGRETNTKLNLDNIEFKVGEAKVRVNGKVEVSIAPFAKKKE